MRTDPRSRNRWLYAVLGLTLAALRDGKVAVARWIIEKALEVQT